MHSCVYYAVGFPKSAVFGVVRFEKVFTTPSRHNLRRLDIGVIISNESKLCLGK